MEAGNIEKNDIHSEQRSSLDDSSLEIVVALLIALVTVIGAIVIWRASVADDGTGDADFAGIQATLNAQKTRAVASVSVYDSYSAFTKYKRNLLLNQLLNEQIEEASEEERERLAPKAVEARELALSASELFNGRFVTEEGTYNFEHELREKWADEAERLDLDPTPHFALANTLRTKANRLLTMEILLAMGLVFYISVELVEERLQYGMTALGSLFALAGTIGALYIEFYM